MFEKIFEWAATLVLIVGVALTSYNIYPENVVISLIGNAMWIVLAIWWKKWSLIVIEVIITSIYIAGLVSGFL